MSTNRKMSTVQLSNTDKLDLITFCPILFTRSMNTRDIVNGLIAQGTPAISILTVRVSEGDGTRGKTYTSIGGCTDRHITDSLKSLMNSLVQDCITGENDTDTTRLVKANLAKSLDEVMRITRTVRNPEDSETPPEDILVFLDSMYGVTNTRLTKYLSVLMVHYLSGLLGQMSVEELCSSKDVINTSFILLEALRGKLLEIRPEHVNGDHPCSWDTQVLYVGNVVFESGSVKAEIRMYPISSYLTL